MGRAASKLDGSAQGDDKLKIQDTSVQVQSSGILRRLNMNENNMTSALKTRTTKRTFMNG